MLVQRCSSITDCRLQRTDADARALHRSRDFFFILYLYTNYTTLHDTTLRQPLVSQPASQPNICRPKAHLPWLLLNRPRNFSQPHTMSSRLEGKLLTSHASFACPVRRLRGIIYDVVCYTGAPQHRTSPNIRYLSRAPILYVIHVAATVEHDGRWDAAWRRWVSRG